jgi:para-aminobenzoate synthetase component I
MLELYEADGAFEKLEAYLAEELRDGFVADVFLGYGLGEPLRREPWPSPPEPCPLPMLAARTRPVDEPTESSGGRHRLGEWEPTWEPEDYGAAVDEVRAAIARGDVYQVNLVQHLSAPFAGSPPALADALAPLRPLHPRPLVGDGWAVVSASPELFLARRGNRLVTMPIKGTRPIGEDIEDAKDAAEHVMIVDLERNDLSRVCEVGSIRWPELMVQHELAGVTHLVSTVEGRVRPDASLAEILRATFPGGSITGAPKIAAIDHIARFEPVGRGAAMGALGTIQANGDFELALTIRTFAIAEGRAHLWVGGGIVWDSDPESEIEESWVKARPLLNAVGSSDVGSTESRRAARV